MQTVRVRKPALTSPEPIVSPCWSPDGSELAYVSFESRKPVIYVHTVATGKRPIDGEFQGFRILRPRGHPMVKKSLPP